MRKKEYVILVITSILIVGAVSQYFSIVNDNKALRDKNAQLEEQLQQCSSGNYNNNLQGSAEAVERDEETAETSNDSKNGIDLNSYISSLKTISYRIDKGSNLTEFAKRYEGSCNLNASIKLIELVNNIKDKNEVKEGAILNIPEEAFDNGSLYTISEDDTWYGLTKKYYSQYDVDQVMNFIVNINDLPTNDLPLGAQVFLPKLS